MNVPGSHITAAEIEALLDTQGKPEETVSTRAWQHLATCLQCRARLLGRKVDVVQKSSPKSECPSVDIWSEVATRELPEVEQIALVKHAALCDHCGAALRRWTEILVEGETAEETRMIAALPSSRAREQRRMGHELARLSDQRESARDRWLGPWLRIAAVPALAMLVVAIGLVGVNWWRSQRSPQHALELLSEAYSSNTTSEFRLPGQKPSRPNITRAMSTPITDDPNFSRAEDLITHQPNGSPEWQRARARAHVLQNMPDQAIRELTDTANRSSDVLIDQAFAHFIRGERSSQNDHGQADIGRAFDLIDAAKKADPNNLVVLYNDALLLQRLALFNEAEAAWKEYLTRDSSSGWAGEARRHLQEVQDILRRHSNYVQSPLLDPAELASLLHRNVSAATSAIEQRPEEYLEIAVRDWLPRSFARNAQAERESLQLLGRVLSSRHHDRWLEDLVNGRKTEQLAKAGVLLAQSIRKNEAGDASEAVDASLWSARLYADDRSIPGELRAKVEELFGLQRSTKANECVANADKATNAVEHSGYAWVKAQFLLQQAICLNMQGNIGTAKRVALRASAESAAGHYPVLGLRAEGLQAALESSAGDLSRSIWMYEKAVNDYWSGTFPGIRAYNLYVSMALAAEDQGCWRFEEALVRQALAMLPHGENWSLEGMAHAQLAKAALLAGDSEAAAAEFARSTELFQNAAPSQATANLEAENEIDLARIAFSKNDSSDAKRYLGQAAAELPNASSRFLSFDYYLVTGEMEWQAGHAESAEEALTSSLKIAEEGLTSLASGAERLRWERQSDRAYRLLVQVSLDRGDVNRAFALWEWYRAVGLRNHLGVGVGTHLSEISTPVESYGQRDSHPVVVSYAFLPRYVALWLIEADGNVQWMALRVSSDRLRKATATFLAQCSDPGSNIQQLRHDAGDLYDWLLSPVGGAIEHGKNVVIEPDGSLNLLPFEALVQPNGRYLGESVQVVLSPGIAYWQLSREWKPLSRKDTAVIVGDPGIRLAGEPSLQPLKATDDETSAVATLFANPVVLTGDEATAANIFEALPQAEILHFAGHAATRSGKLELLVAPNSPESNYDTISADTFEAKLLRRCKLATLSACSTARGEGEGLNDPSSLVRALLAGGVSDVIASRWEVDSASAAQYMNSFYRSLAAGNSVTESAHGASVEIHRTQVHPFYWAAFAMYGRP